MQDSELAHVFDQASGPLSVNRVAKELGVDWHTAKKRLDKEEERGNLYRADMSSRLTLYSPGPLPFEGS